MELKRISEEKCRIWSEELPTFFKDSVADPCYELETYGLDVAQAQVDDDQEKLEAIVQEIFKGLERNMSNSWGNNKRIEFRSISEKKWQSFKENTLKKIGGK